MLFQKITIIGCGLIGSSILRALGRTDLAGIVRASDSDPEVCEALRHQNLAHDVFIDARRSVIDSDLVILCVPLDQNRSVAEHIGPALKAGAVLTDVGSVKQAALKDISFAVPESVHFVPAHPVAGREISGLDSGRADLFDGRWCLLTPDRSTEIRAVEKVTRFWEALGAQVEIMPPAHHDLVMGMVSHLPQMIAYTIIGTAATLESDIKADVIKYAGSGFEDFTRIAASNPSMWVDILLSNRECMLDIIEAFQEDLAIVQKALRTRDKAQLETAFQRAQDIKRHFSTPDEDRWGSAMAGQDRKSV